MKIYLTLSMSDKNIAFFSNVKNPAKNFMTFQICSWFIYSYEITYNNYTDIQNIRKWFRASKVKFENNSYIY